MEDKEKSVVLLGAETGIPQDMLSGQSAVYGGGAAIPKEETPNAVIRFIDTTNKTLADQGDPLARGFRAAFSPEYYQRMKQEDARAARFAELKLQEAEQRVQMGDISIQAAQFNLNQSKANAPLALQRNQLAIEGQRLNNARLEQNLNESKEAWKLKQESSAMDLEYKRRQFQRLQEQDWVNDYNKFQAKAIDQIKKMSNHSQLNIAGQHIIDESEYLKAMVDMTYLIQSSQKDPAKFKYFLSRMEEEGWTQVPREDGEIELRRDVDGKPYSFVANPEGLKRLTSDVQQRVKEDITAAQVVGSDAVTMGHGSAKVMLNTPLVKEVCGDDSTAYKIYSDVFNRQQIDKKTGAVRPMFSKEQKMYHMLNVCIGSVIEDNQFSESERANLLPQAVQMIKSLGGELKIGTGVDDTEVIWGRNQGYAQTYKLRDFLHNVLNPRDVISPAFGERLKEIQKIKEEEKIKKEQQTLQQQLIQARIKQTVNSSNQKKNDNQETTGDSGNELTEEEKTKIRKLYYGSNITEFNGIVPDFLKEKIKAAMKAVDAEQKNLMSEEGVERVGDLSDSSLQKLDALWHKTMGGVKYDKFYSPYSDLILTRELDAIYNRGIIEDTPGLTVDGQVLSTPGKLTMSTQDAKREKEIIQIFYNRGIPIGDNRYQAVLTRRLLSGPTIKDFENASRKILSGDDRYTRRLKETEAEVSKIFSGDELKKIKAMNKYNKDFFSGKL